ncbi:uncharacterized protein DS421_8g244190 [Arachis hypogaea]|nr:uncharacterized protein LOC112708437 [Arachis hypogaea]QHO31744.1 uncharacterized protein DS421_8g244190 [Arachis hypogaea]
MLLNKQEKLYGFSNGGDGSSVWDRNFPFMVVADEIFQSTSDVMLVNDVSDIGVDQSLQVLRFQLGSISQSQEEKHKKMLKKTNDLEGLKEDLDLKKKVIDKLKKNFAKEKEEELMVIKSSYEKDTKLLKKKEGDLSSMKD